MMSHDWPRGIYHYGNTGQLLKRKPFFREEVEMGTLGSPAAEELLHAIKPDYWFSAHLHVKFSCVVDHQVNFFFICPIYLAMGKNGFNAEF